MAGDSYATITEGDKSPDLLKFRSGSCTVSLWVTSKTSGNAIFYASDVMIKHPVGGLSQCTLQVPVGLSVGPKSVDGVDTNSFENLNKYFRKFSKVEVRIEVASLEATQDIGNAMDPGKHTIFSGLVGSVRFEWAGRSSLVMQLNLVHELVMMASGSPLFSRLVSADGFADMDTVFSGFTESLGADKSREPWVAFRNAVDKFLVATDGGSFSKNWVNGAADAAKIKAANARSAALLTKVSSLAELKYSGTASEPTQYLIRNLMASIITDTRSNMNLIAAASGVAQILACRLLFTLREGYFIPYDPLWVRSDMKYIRGGMAFNMEDIRRSGANYSVEGYDITGTVVRFMSDASMSLFGSAILKFGSWLIPDKDIDSDYALYDEAIYPSWLSAFGLSPIGPDGGAAGTTPMASAKPTPSADPKNAKGTTVPEAATVGQELDAIVSEYAYFNTMVRNLGTNSAQIVVGLRGDIVPGICIGVVTRAPTGEDYTIYGYVDSVVTSISAGERSAKTTINLKSVRGEHEQNIIDESGKAHFAWTKVASKLNALSLWSPTNDA